ncbi:ABC transporter substrate-binding protein [Pseudarthrobacter sulfonivorans]|uniref:ABC transporter substrate-binding protein n=1 Tax=Pseudarthrobacter sulfonivorans TaxID=121292 RepID=A0A0U3PNC2_9MICC|nr:ABC transporter substrate-binding protein [Pseudarthrobacter sulfonivorans]
MDGKGQTLNAYLPADSVNSEAQKAWFAEVGAKFKEETGAEVHWETFASANEELTKIQTSVVSGQGPDLYGIGTSFTPTAYSTGAFVKLDDTLWSTMGGRDKFVPAQLGISGPNEDNQIAVPLATDPFVIAYNTELFQAAGMDKPANSWDGLVEQAKKLTTDTAYGMAIPYKDNFAPWKFIWGMSAQAGNPLVDGKSVSLDDSSTVEAYETFFGWLSNDKVVDPASVGWNFSQATAEFASGKAAMLPMASSRIIPTLEKSAVAGKVKFALLPTTPPGETSRPSDGVEAASIIGGTNLVIADYSQQKHLAAALIKVMTGEEAQLSQYTKLGILPSTKAAQDALPASNYDYKPFLEAASKSKATPFTAAWSDVQLAMTNVVVQSLPELSSGTLDRAKIKQRVEEAQKSAESAVERIKG